jgi:hypothetical protein
LALALVAVGAAAAENYQYRIVAKDKALASSIVLKQTELPGPAGWTGGAVKPDRSGQTEADRCNGYLAKQSDLVVTGDAETRYSFQATQIDTQVDLFRTAAMVEKDWQRNALHPGLVECLRKGFATRLPKTERFVSLNKVAYPRFGTHTLAFRMLFDVITKSGAIHAGMDVIYFSRGRTEATLFITGVLANPSDQVALKLVGTKVGSIVSAKMPAT